MNKEIEKLLSYAESHDWYIDHIDGGIILSKYSPDGQDFSFFIPDEGTAEDFLENIEDYYRNYDVSYEAYLWLDEDGHGKNGAPYDMRDLYDDMECCRDNVGDLYDYLTDKLYEMRRLQ